MNTTKMSRQQYHAVRIHSSGYQLVGSFGADSLATAAQIVLGKRVCFAATILRDGATGKRYSVAECEQLATKDQP